MKEEELQYFETLCDKLYGQASSQEKHSAGEELTNITKNPSFISDVNYIINCTHNTNALICLSLSLKHCIMDNWNSLTDDGRLELRNLLIEFIQQNGQNLSSLIVSSFSTVISIISKLAWITDRRQRTLLSSIENIIDMGGNFSIIGLNMMSDFVEQMNLPLSMDNTEHRKTSTQFVSENLPDILEFALSVLHRIHNGASEYQDISFRNAVLESVFKILSRCLLFDFTGCTCDDGSDEMWVLQIPSVWEGLICKSEQLNMLFDIYNSVEPPLTRPALEIIMLFASIRRSLFRDGNARLTYLRSIIIGVESCLSSGHGLNDEDTFNMMCQLLGRLKSNFQLSELMKTPEYADCFQLIADFTCTSLREWNACSNSINFLLTLWSRMACANRYVQLNESMMQNSKVLEMLLPRIVEAYVEGRLIQINSDDDSMNPLADPEALHEEMTQFPQIVRFVYQTSGEFLVKRMEMLMKEYTDVLTSLDMNNTNETLIEQAKRLENSLALLVHVISSVVSAQSFMLVQVKNNHNTFDAQLCRNVLLLLQMVTSRQERQQFPYRCHPHLEVAFLSFFLIFRRTFINDERSFAIIREYDDREGDEIPPRASAYHNFFVDVGFSSHYEAMRTIWEKICKNLKAWSDNEMVITETLKLLKDITGGYESSKMLLDLDSVNYVLQHHTEEEFPFLQNPGYVHLHSGYYEALTNLILLRNIPGRFEIFVKPIIDRIEYLHKQSTFSQSDFAMIVFVFRDARGVVNACTNKRSFNVFFELLYPHGFEVMQHALRERGNEEELVSSIMKFLSSLVLNKESRIDYCNDVANGVTLFKETVNVIQVYGNLLLDNFKSFTQCPAYVYKGICQLFHVMERFLKGNYIPFGVFELYNDNCLSTILSMYIQFVIRTPFNQLSQWPKYESTVFTFLELLFANHLNTVSSIDTNSFITIVESVCSGVASFNPEIVRSSAHILDTIASYLYFNQYKNTTTVNNIKRILVAQPNFWEVVMTSLLNAFVFGSSNCLWDLTRPIFSIFLVKREAFDSYIKNISANQQPYVVTNLMNDTKVLLSNIDYSVGERSRDDFSKKAIAWRRQFLSYMQLYHCLL